MRGFVAAFVFPPHPPAHVSSFGFSVACYLPPAAAAASVFASFHGGLLPSSFLIHIDDDQLTPGTCVHVAAGQKHSLENTGDVDMVLFYFGIAVEPPSEEWGGGGGGGGSGKGRGGGGGGKGGAGGEAKALHAIGV